MALLTGARLHSHAVGEGAIEKLSQKVIDRLFYLADVWLRRRKAYVRVALLLIGGGLALLSVSWVHLALEAFDILASPAGERRPMWLDPVLGFVPLLLGVAVFVFFYRNDPDRTTPPPSITIKPARGWTFEETALQIGVEANVPVVLEGFSEAEREMRLRQQQIRALTVEDLLRDLRALAIGGALPTYDVVSDGVIITVRRT